MLLIIGNEGCSNCEVTKRLLDSRGIIYEYKLLGELSSEDKNKYIKMARSSGIMEMPIIVKDDKCINRSELLYAK